jgi:hypothetical protein
VRVQDSGEVRQNIGELSLVGTRLAEVEAATRNITGLIPKPQPITPPEYQTESAPTSVAPESELPPQSQPTNGEIDQLRSGISELGSYELPDHLTYAA